MPGGDPGRVPGAARPGRVLFPPRQGTSSSHAISLVHAGTVRLGGRPRTDRVAGGCHCLGWNHLQSRSRKGSIVGSVIKKRRKRMAKKKHRKLLKKTRIQRRRAGK
ncbi:hypothetical protein GCM10027030_24550 [Luteococcus sediminum]